jgi:hypothetical protein
LGEFSHCDLGYCPFVGGRLIFDHPQIAVEGGDIAPNRRRDFLDMLDSVVTAKSDLG